MNFTITQVTAPDNDVRMLIAGLDAELALLTPDCGQRHGLNLEALFQPHVCFFVAHDGGEAVGCGGVALFAGFAEVKRMYVRPGWRGRGVADAIMDRLVAEAVGLSCMRLETGDNFAPALRFYGRHGFQPCAVFEPYASMPSHSVAASVFLERALP